MNTLAKFNFSEYLNEVSTHYEYLSSHEKNILRLILSKITPSYGIPYDLDDNFQQIVPISGQYFTEKDIFYVSSADYAWQFDYSIEEARQHLAEVAETLMKKVICIKYDTRICRFHWISLTIFDSQSYRLGISFNSFIIPALCNMNLT